MMFTNDYPYTDFHEMNLDWMLENLNTTKQRLDYLYSIKEPYITPQKYKAFGDGVHDDTNSFKSAISEAKEKHITLFIPAGDYLISSSLELEKIVIFGDDNANIKTSSNFDIFKIHDNVTINGLSITGPYDGGETVSDYCAIRSSMNGTFPAYKINLSNIKIRNISGYGIYLDAPAYSNIINIDCRVCGKDALKIIGTPSFQATTVNIYNSIFSDCRGYSAYLEECVNISFIGVIGEYAKSFSINGTTNRNICFINCYRENSSDGKFITLNGSGYCVNVISCYGSGSSIDYNSGYYGCIISGNVSITLPDSAPTWIMSNQNGVVNIGEGKANTITVNNLKCGGNWQYGHLILDAGEGTNQHIWSDSNNRILYKASAPANVNDGSVLLHYADVPAGSGSFGVVGEFAIESGYLYVRAAEGWRRILLEGF